MTDNRAMTERNASIVTYYQGGRSLTEVGKHFKLGRQRVLQILKAAGAWKPYVKGERDKFLGVTVKGRTKDGLAKLAGARGVSVSRAASDVLDKAVDEAPK